MSRESRTDLSPGGNKLGQISLEGTTMGRGTRARCIDRHTRDSLAWWVVGQDSDRRFWRLWPVALLLKQSKPACMSSGGC